MKYNPDIHHRRSIRLPGYDYAQAGLYFLTFCTQNRTPLFGDVVNGKMVLSDAGKMVEKWWYKLPEKFPDIECGEMVVMPNHFHGIVKNVGVRAAVGETDRAAVGADPRVCPTRSTGNTGTIPVSYGTGNSLDPGFADRGPLLGEHVGSPLRAVVQWFKTMSTNDYIRNVKSNGWLPFDKKLWQRNYYEHIIRNENAYRNISNYIINNPANWDKDIFSR